MGQELKETLRLNRGLFEMKWLDFPTHDIQMQSYITPQNFTAPSTFQTQAQILISHESITPVALIASTTLPIFLQLAPFQG